MQASEYVPENKKVAWVRGFGLGEEWGLIALALTLFPNLTSIDFWASYGFQAFHDLTLSLDMIFQRIVDAQHPEGSLTKLTSVSISGGFDGIYLIDVLSRLPRCHPSRS